MKSKEEYQNLLKDPRWIEKRNEILTRDENRCQFCGARNKYLHIHHKDYINGFLPWEYPDCMLVTLCEDCHNLIHQECYDIGVSIGDVFHYEHSDYTNICVVYFIDYKKRTILTLEYDDGAGYDTIWYKETSFDRFFNRYFPFEAFNGKYCWGWFDEWWEDVTSRTERTPMAFRYNLPTILERNETLRRMAYGTH